MVNLANATTSVSASKRQGSQNLETEDRLSPTSILASNPVLQRIVAWGGVITVAITNGAKLFEVTSKLQPEFVRVSNATRGFVYANFGQSGLAALHYLFLALVLLLVLIGYAALAYWLDRRYAARLVGARQTLVRSVIVVAAVAAAVYSAASIVSPAKNVKATLETDSKAFGQELLQWGPPEGGIRYNRNDSSVRPQAWTTAQFLVAFLANRHEPLTPAEGELVRRHLNYLDKARLPDPQGWAYMEPIDWGVTEIAAWVLLAEVASVQPAVAASIWQDDMQPILQRIKRDAQLVRARQQNEGGWSPIDDIRNPGYARTYSTIMAIWALAELGQSRNAAQISEGGDADRITRGIKWLLARYDPTLHSWVPNPERKKQKESFPGLTVQVIFVLARTGPTFTLAYKNDEQYREALDWFVREIDINSEPTLEKRLSSLPPSENARTHDSDRYLEGSRYLVEGSTFLWMPWTLALCSESDTIQWETLDRKEAVRQGCRALTERINALASFVREETFSYAMAEALLGLRLNLNRDYVN